MTLEALPGEWERLLRFLHGGESSAAVLALDLAVLARIWPGCEWEDPLLSIRNHLADHGIKFYVAMTPPAVQHHLLDWFALPRNRSGNYGGVYRRVVDDLNEDNIESGRGTAINRLGALGYTARAVRRASCSASNRGPAGAPFGHPAAPTPFSG
jgi:hypothetical protein